MFEPQVIIALRYAAKHRKAASESEYEAILHALIVGSPDESEAKAAQSELFHFREQRKAQLQLDAIIVEAPQGTNGVQGLD